MDVSWFHVFDSTRQLWLTDHDWSRSYYDAQEFSSYESAAQAGREQMVGVTTGDTLVVLADYGQIE